jgi:hypothetical protein
MNNLGLCMKRRRPAAFRALNAKTIGALHRIALRLDRLVDNTKVPAGDQHQGGIRESKWTQPFDQPTQLVNRRQAFPTHLTKQQLLFDSLLKVLRSKANFYVFTGQSNPFVGRAIPFALSAPDTGVDVLD